MPWGRILRAVLVGVGIVGMALAVLVPLLISPPSPRLKTYNMVLFQGDEPLKLSWQGTHISNSGLCTTIWKGTTADSVICCSHLITEAEEGVAEPAAQPKEAKLGR